MEKSKFQSLTQENLQAVYQLFKRNEPFYQIPLEFFQRGSLKDEGFEPDLSLIFGHPETKKPIAAFIAVIKKGWVRKDCFLKAIIVDQPYRKQGIGSLMLKEIVKRARSKLPWYSNICYGDCPPRYWQPGVDLRHTALLFFLKKQGFKTHGMRHNLTYLLNHDISEPESVKNNYTFARIKPDEFELTKKFVKANFRLGFWSQEVTLSFENNPPTTFIAKDKSSAIVGWATHSAHFPGSFGPTGVKKSERGKGIGGALLRWCIYDMKQAGLDTCTILWVVGDTIKFYSKVLGAYIHPIFYPMRRRL